MLIFCIVYRLVYLAYLEHKQIDNYLYPDLQVCIM